MNNYQKGVMNCYVRFMNIWVKEYGQNIEFKYHLGYNYLSFFTNKPQLSWVILEELKTITDKNNTSWSILQGENGLIIKFEK